MADIWKPRGKSLWSLIIAHYSTKKDICLNSWDKQQPPVKVINDNGRIADVRQFWNNDLSVIRRLSDKALWFTAVSGMLGPALWERGLALLGMQVSKQSQQMGTNLKFFVFAGLEGEVHTPKLHTNFHWELHGGGLYVGVSASVRDRDWETDNDIIQHRNLNICFSHFGVLNNSHYSPSRMSNIRLRSLTLCVCVYCSLVQMCSGSQCSQRRLVMK